MKYYIPTLLFAPLLVLSGLAVARESSPLSLKTRIALPNVNGRIDHLSVDVKGRFRSSFAPAYPTITRFPRREPEALGFWTPTATRSATS